MPGRVGLIVLAGCLPPAPIEPAPRAPVPLVLEPAVYHQQKLYLAGAPRIDGHFQGACAGPVQMEIRTASEPRPLTVVTEEPPDFTILVPPGNDLVLRWGCDPDGDGKVEDPFEAPISPPLPPVTLRLDHAPYPLVEAPAFTPGWSGSPPPPPTR